MPTVEKLSIALPVGMANIVRQAVEAGEYSSNSEVVRDALRDWTHKRKLREQGLRDLQQRWQEAMADRGDGFDPKPVFDRLEGKYERLAKKNGR
jgi:antitoxin ParD1/3/4